MEDLYIRLTGDPVLRKKAAPVEKIDAEVVELIQKMAAIMYKAPGVGLAAPQIGVLKRVVVIDIGEGLLGLINPKIVATDGDKEYGVEGCLSFPQIVGDVPRHTKIMIQAQDIQGNTVELTGEGLLARAFQHEIDHLDGILFIDKAQNLRPVPSPDDD